MESPNRPTQSAAGAGTPGKPKMPTWVKVLLVFGGLAFVGVAVLVGVAATIAPKMQEKQSRFTCVSNLSQLAGLFVVSYRAPPQGPVPRSGPALFVEWRTTLSKVRPGQEAVFLCPGDRSAVRLEAPGARDAYDSVDLEHVPRALCSYAVRDFDKYPFDWASPTVQVIAACTNHRNGANVAFDNGSARFIEREELGLAPGDEITVGPGSKSELLRVVRYGDGSVK